MTEQVKVVKIDTSQAQTSVKDLRNELKELRSTMLSTEQGTEEYNEALRQSAEIQHTLKEQMEEINASAMDFGQIVGNCTQAVGGLVGGFQAATAVMNLFGAENEDVIKTLKTMQQMMAITQALPAIDKGVKAFKRLSIAIKGASTALKGVSTAAISTGIGALIVAIGLLIANWDKVSAAMKRWGIINETTKEKIEEQKKKIEELRGELAKLEGDYENWERNNKISKLNSQAKKSYNELEESIVRYQKQLDIIVAKQKLPENRSKSRWEALQKEGQALLDNINLLKKQQNAILDNANSYKELTESTDERVKTIEELNEEVRIWLELQIKEGDTHNAVADAIRKRREELQKLREAEEEDEDLSNITDYIDRIYGTIESLQKAFGVSSEERYAQEFSALESWKKMELTKFKDNEQKKYEIMQEYARLRSALEKEQVQLTMQRYSIAASSIGQIFNGLGDLMAEGSEEQKAFQIMGATVNMLGGITAAISGAFTTHSGPWDIALAVLQAAAIAASGGATIAQMVNTNKNNASSMSKTASMSANAINSIIAPVQYTQDVQGASIEGAIKDTKVYVTETDITDTQNKVKVTENEARF